MTTQIHSDEFEKPLVLPLLDKIRTAGIPILFVLTNKYAVDSDERTGTYGHCSLPLMVLNSRLFVVAIVSEIQSVLKIPSESCFLINSRKKDSYGVEGINELLKVRVSLSAVVSCCPSLVSFVTCAGCV